LFIKNFKGEKCFFSWGAGKDPWGSAADSLFTTPAMDDGKLEVVGISGAFHMVREQVT
jgi:hypothetical protein